MVIFKAKPSKWPLFRDEKLGAIDRLFIEYERTKPDFHRRMFDEDFAGQFIWMYPRNSNLFEVVSNDHMLTRKLLANVKSRYTPRSIDQTIMNLLSEVAQYLVRYDKAYYFLYDDMGTEELRIAQFSSQGVFRLFGMHVQWVPKRTEKHWNQDDKELSRELRILDAAKVMRFCTPKSIKRMLRSQNKTLAVLDKNQYEHGSVHPAVTHDNPNPINHFDFRKWSDMQERVLYRASRSSGWNGRKYDSQKRSDFFDCHRLIRFRKNQILLRDNILKQLNGELTRVGRYYNSGYSVEILAANELPSVTYLEELEKRLTSENVGFEEVITYCYQN